MCFLILNHIGQSYTLCETSETDFFPETHSPNDLKDTLAQKKSSCILLQRKKILIYFCPFYFKECWKLSLFVAKKINFVFTYFKWEQAIHIIIKFPEVILWVWGLKLHLFPRVGKIIHRNFFFFLSYSVVVVTLPAWALCFCCVNLGKGI